MKGVSGKLPVKIHSISYQYIKGFLIQVKPCLKTYLIPLKGLQIQMYSKHNLDFGSIHTQNLHYYRHNGKIKFPMA